MTLETPLKEQLKKIQKQKRTIAKQENELKQQLILEKDMSKWKAIMDTKTACLKIESDSIKKATKDIDKVIAAANLPKKVTKANLRAFPDYYLYQHPLKKRLKTHDRTEEWVQIFIGESPMDRKGGMTGTEQDLIDTARKTRLKVWLKAINPKKQKKK